jgi:putative tricarboxylic transport membrane protein
MPGDGRPHLGEVFRKLDLVHGIISVFEIHNLLYCFIGCTMGTLVGVLPGLGPGATLSMLLPVTLYLNPTGSIIMLAGILYGAAYGGSTTSILVNIPGEVGSVVTTFDGFPMTKQGRAGEALWISAVGSFIAGTLGAMALSFTGPIVAIYALKFGPPEYAGLLLFSLTAIVSLSGASITKGIGAGLAGMVLSSVGVDPVTGVTRFAYGMIGAMRGIDLVPMAIGLFGISEILLSAEAGLVKIYEGKLGKMMPRGKELRKGLLASLRGTALGIPLGVLPGMIPGVVAYLAYDLEKKISKYPEKFGTGVIEGVASVEANNNAVTQGNFIPLMCLGIPTGTSLAIILAALMMYGLKPGPLLFVENKEFVWTVIGSMYIGNVMLLVLNLPLVGVWAKISTLPYKYLGPIILGICVAGAYAPRNTLFDVWVAFGAGVLGYLMKKNEWPQAALMLGFILGPMLELSFRQSLSMGGPTVFFARPIAVAFLVLAIVVLVISIKFLKRIPQVIREGSD